MNEFTEVLRRLAREEATRVINLHIKPQYGNIAEYDLATHRAKVIIQPSGVVSNWLQCDSPWIGNGWGMIAPFSKGDQVKVVFPEFGDNEGGVVARYFDQRNPPPKGVKGGEFWLVHQKGSVFKLTADGNISHHSTSLVQVGNLQNTIHKMVIDTFEALYNSHSHGGSPPPDTPMTNVHMTTILKGN